MLNHKRSIHMDVLAFILFKFQNYHKNLLFLLISKDYLIFLKTFFN